MHHDNTFASFPAPNIIGRSKTGCYESHTSISLTADATALLPIALRSPAVMSAGELALWAQIGRNSIPRLVADHGIRELTGQQRHQRYAVTDVLCNLLKVTLKGPTDFSNLLVPLQTTEWVINLTGMSRSTLSERARLGHLPFRAIDLFRRTSHQAAPRGRRWIASQVMAHLTGTSIPYMERHTAHSRASRMPVGNGFAALWPWNSEETR